MKDFALEHFLNEVPVGWHDLVRDTHKQIIKVDPEYRIRQIKEKFGGLRYYYEASRSHVIAEIERVVKTSEVAASIICQNCGKVGASLGVKNGWYATLCETHFEEWNR